MLGSLFELLKNLDRGEVFFGPLILKISSRLAGVLWESNIVENQPIKILQKATSNLVLIKLKDGKEYRGRLKEIDMYMNLVLEGAEELMDGTPTAKFGEVLIRGNNILYIKPDLTQIIWENKE